MPKFMVSVNSVILWFWYHPNSSFWIICLCQSHLILIFTRLCWVIETVEQLDCNVFNVDICLLCNMFATNALLNSLSAFYILVTRLFVWENKIYLLMILLYIQRVFAVHLGIMCLWFTMVVLQFDCKRQTYSACGL